LWALGTWERVRRYLGQVKIATIEMIQVRSDDTMEKMFSRSAMIENYGFWQGVCGGAGFRQNPFTPDLEEIFRPQPKARGVEGA